jgi:hypothetical protein
MSQTVHQNHHAPAEDAIVPLADALTQTMVPFRSHAAPDDGPRYSALHHPPEDHSRLIGPTASLAALALAALVIGALVIAPISTDGSRADGMRTRGGLLPGVAQADSPPVTSNMAPGPAAVAGD